MTSLPVTSELAMAIGLALANKLDAEMRRILESRKINAKVMENVEPALLENICDMIIEEDLLEETALRLINSVLLERIEESGNVLKQETLGGDPVTTLYVDHSHNGLQDDFHWKGFMHRNILFAYERLVKEESIIEEKDES